jgi:hypothetical protein
MAYLPSSDSRRVTAGEPRNPDTDEDWVPDLQDILSGNAHMTIDLTVDSDSEVSCYRESSKTVTRH